MKKLAFGTLLALLTLSTPSFGAAKAWLVKCGQDSDLNAVSATLKAKGVNVLSTSTDQGRFRDDMCGASGSLLAFYVRGTQVAKAKDTDATLKAAPEGFPPKARKVH